MDIIVMGAEVMDCVNISVACDGEALRKYPRTSFQDERRVSAHPLHRLSGNTMTWNNKQTGGVDSAPAIHAIFAPLFTPPPPVDTSTCNYRIKKIRFGTVGTWRRRTSSSLATCKPLSIAPLNIIHSSLDLTASHRRDDIFLKFFYWAARYSHDQHNVADLSPDMIIDILIFGYLLLPFSSKNMDIQTYCHAADMYRGTSVRKTADGLFFATPSEGDQKKERKQPKPTQPIKPKTRKQKSEREDDREKEEENKPRTEELARWIMQQSRVYRV